ncbi:phosphatase 1 regulatory subunit 3C-like protein [Dinothrombium tinctorium]|uniref:Phosphatase 1 regulatory subunit 3C-like protein n=1 Tax=Dinothrombium tinctorium TaxID=1965070 RepID=A0A443QFW7_9ACAR|nr:phosphatase 1 regulatory subunit 3C-like protein [Dinothrombium tinctorium]
MINVKCIILVVNLSFSKHVTVRYTTDNWQSWVDVEAKYVPNSCNGWSDKFMADFSICTDGSSSALVPGQKILLAVRYESDGREYWDNNLGANYSFTYRL